MYEYITCNVPDQVTKFCMLFKLGGNSFTHGPGPHPITRGLPWGIFSPPPYLTLDNCGDIVSHGKLKISADHFYTSGASSSTSSGALPC